MCTWSSECQQLELNQCPEAHVSMVPTTTHCLRLLEKIHPDEPDEQVK